MSQLKNKTLGFTLNTSKPISYSIEKCGICGSMDTMVTDHRYRCYDCGYNSPYSWNKSV